MADTPKPATGTIQDHEDFRLVDSQNCGIPNYPMTTAAAEQALKDLLQKQIHEGFKYAGTITRNLSGTVREYYVFYPE